ncbi:OmpP1/FadL family transporter [Paracoccus sp. p4-l81]|uniref:OmpP1/FadL family transporter n=1 Tax=unclassified Paracoccus (in: a-proteobacteria) TaxID=2688777 RepID=UPI0035B8355D
MKKIMMGASALAILSTPALAGGLDRSGQSIGVLFEQGNYVELSYGRIMPSVDGRDVAIFGGRPTGSVASDHSLPGFAYKRDIDEKLSFAVIYDHAYGADVTYDPALSVALGGTNVKVKSQGLTGLVRYKIDDAWSVHGGLRVSRSSADVTLKGRAYGGVSGYNASMDTNTSLGYILGVAWEKPEIAARVALTYFSKTKHDFNTTETLNGVPMALVLASQGKSAKLGSTEVETPQAVNLDFQTGVAADTLVFGSIRWADWSAFKVDPAGFKALTGGGLVDLKDSWTYTLGVGRKFNENWSGSVFVSYEPKGDSKLVSPLAPTDGYKGIGVAAVYTQDNMKVTLGARYLNIGDADAETANAARANMTKNDAVAVGLKVGWTF